MKTLFEKITSGQYASYTIREFKLPAFDAPMHFHPEFELTYIVSGTGKRVVGDHITDFGPGDMAFIGSNLPHCWHSDKQLTKANTHAHSIVLQFKPDFLGKEFFCVPELSHIKDFLYRSAKGLNIDPIVKKSISEKMMRLSALKGVKGIFEILQIMDELAAAQNHKILGSDGFSNYSDTYECDKINKVCKYVFDHFTEQINLAEAAAMVNMNVPAFCYYFKKRTRRTFSEFVNHIRIGYSCKLLMSTEKSVSEICFSSGFNNLSNFNRRFKEIHKVSPMVYRQQLTF